MIVLKCIVFFIFLITCVRFLFLYFEIHSHMSSYEHDIFRVRFNAFVCNLLGFLAFFATNYMLIFFILLVSFFLLFFPSVYIRFRNWLYVNHVKKHRRSYKLEYKLLYFITDQDKWTDIEKGNIKKHYYDFLHFFVKKKKTKEDKENMYQLFDTIHNMDKADLINDGCITFTLSNSDFEHLQKHVEQQYKNNSGYFDWKLERDTWDIHNLSYIIYEGVLLDALLFIQTHGTIEKLEFHYRINIENMFDTIGVQENKIALFKNHTFIKYLDENDFSNYPEEFRIEKRT